MLSRNSDSRPMLLAFITGSKANRPGTHQESFLVLCFLAGDSEVFCGVLRLLLREDATDLTW